MISQLRLSLTPATRPCRAYLAHATPRSPGVHCDRSAHAESLPRRGEDAPGRRLLRTEVWTESDRWTATDVCNCNDCKHSNPHLRCRNQGSDPIAAGMACRRSSVRIRSAPRDHEARRRRRVKPNRGLRTPTSHRALPGSTGVLRSAQAPSDGALAGGRRAERSRFARQP